MFLYACLLSFILIYSSCCIPFDRTSLPILFYFKMLGCHHNDKQPTFLNCFCMYSRILVHCSYLISNSRHFQSTEKNSPSLFPDSPQPIRTGKDHALVLHNHNAIFRSSVPSTGTSSGNMLAQNFGKIFFLSFAISTSRMYSIFFISELPTLFRLPISEADNVRLICDATRGHIEAMNSSFSASCLA